LLIRITSKAKKMDQILQNIIREGKSVDATHEQEQEYLSLFHNPELEFDLKTQLLGELHQTENEGNNKLYFDNLFEKIWHNRRIDISDSHSKNRLFIKLVQIAAVLVTGLIIGYLMNYSLTPTAPVYYTSIAPKGSVSEMYLPDGSHIFLNAGSEIKYSVEGANGMREVFLTGEAWFQVAKMKRKPFLVHTPFYDVQVTGTTFDVKAYAIDKEVITTLEEGAVHVTAFKNSKFNEEKVLIPGEQLIYNKELNSIQVSGVNTKWYTSWKENKLMFVNMSVKDLRILLERKYGVDIEISDSSILKYHYDGTIKNESILEVLEILRQTLPIKYQIIGQKIIINKELKVKGGRMN